MPIQIHIESSIEPNFLGAGTELNTTKFNGRIKMYGGRRTFINGNHKKAKKLLIIFQILKFPLRSNPSELNKLWYDKNPNNIYQKIQSKIYCLSSSLNQ